MKLNYFLLPFCLLLVFATCKEEPTGPITPDPIDDPIETMDFTETLRFANFNVSMFRNSSGQLGNELEESNSNRVKKAAEIIQRTRPDFIALMEFDYDETGTALKNFQKNYLEVSQNGADTVQYAYAYQVSSNTGVLSEADLDGNGNVTLPNDAYGFGNFAGQYAFAILSKYPLVTEEAKTFQNFLWKDMPDALLPNKSNGESYYSEEALEVFRLSSKNHIDMPVRLPDGRTIHALLSHPTPPVFDGSEDRNGKRNHDEIRLWADYIDNAAYLQDDGGSTGGLTGDSHFVVMGDLNADPIDGDSADDAILQLLNHTKVNQAVTFGEHTPKSNGGAAHNQQGGDDADPAFDTSFFGLRTDYVLPSATLNVSDSGVFWPASGEDFASLVANEAASDHLMVWVDLNLP